jgi:[protein-PII] uridylyltransferase
VSAQPSAAGDSLAAQLARAPDDANWRDIAKALLAEHREDLRVRYERGEDVERLIARHCAAIDIFVGSAWSRCIPEGAPLGLLATGGYGRGELYPLSDIDVLVLAEPEAQEIFADNLSRFFALLWDAGLAAGHATRSVDECQHAARDDITVLTALSELRPLDGPVDTARLRETLSPKHIWPAKEYFEAKRAEQRTRHARFNDTADNLEPNLKEGPGGLRDLHTVTWMGMRLYGVPGLRALVPLGLLGENECGSLEREWRVLAKLRFGLHLISKRREERLLFDHQKTLAASMGLRDEGSDNLAVEQMMQGFFRSAATTLRINDRLLQRFEEQLAGPTELLPVEPGFVLRHGYLAMEQPKKLAGDMAEILRLFAVWSRAGEDTGLHSETARALAEELPTILPYPEQAPEVRAYFLALLAEPNAVLMLKRMARLGVLARYLPAFGKVSGRMQYDLFHVYTVDQHTLTVLKIMDGFLRGPTPGFSMAHEVVPRLRKPFLLLLAGLFHDIAKGRGGDHSVLGADDVREFGEAHALPSADIELLIWLVREHLVMSVTAQRQDISDPEVVTRFATRIADREHLEYLYLLTCADIAGTSPKLWNAWKDRLLADLYTATRYALRRGLEHPLNADDIIADTRNMALAGLMNEDGDEAAAQALWATFPEEAFLRYRPEQLLWQTRGILEHLQQASQVLVRSHEAPGSIEVFVRTPDRDGLFAALVATLDRLDLGVFDARVLTSTDGYALDNFQVLAGAHTPEPLRIAQTLLGALRDPTRVQPVRRAMPRQLKHFRVATRVDFDNDEKGGRTRLSLVCSDQPGLLAKVAQVLRRQRLRVHDARIATFGERVEDFFLLSDEQDRPIVDEKLLESLRSDLIASVEGEA